MSKKQKVAVNEQSFPKIKVASIDRIQCNCMALKHKLINNCLNCGRVICDLQGQGPCMFCGNIVHRPDTQFLDRNDAELFPGLDKQQLKIVSAQRSKAIQHKNVLVDRDGSSNIVQNIYDQQTDYYELSEDNWAKESDRKYAVERILMENKFKREQGQMQSVHFDAQTNQWIRDVVDFEQRGQAFKKEAQQFITNSQAQQIKKKITSAKPQTNFDQRIMNNEKGVKLLQEIIGQLKPETGSGKKKPKKPTKEYHEIQIIEG